MNANIVTRTEALVNKLHKMIDTSPRPVVRVNMVFQPRQVTYTKGNQTFVARTTFNQVEGV